MSSPSSTAPPPPPRPGRRTLAGAGVLVSGAGLGYFLISTGPVTEPEEKMQAAKIVQVVSVDPGSHAIHVTAYGTVIPAREVTIQPQVSGRVVRQHDGLVPGGQVAAGEELVTIDPEDYRLALAEMEAALEEAEFEFDLEQGRQVVASREWSLLQGDLSDGQVNQDLVLRKPHLERAQAAIDRAHNAIAKAELDLARTTIEAPFDAVVISESAEVGQLLSAGDTIATLAGTDEFWVQITLPVSDLRHLQFRQPGAGRGARAEVGLDTGEAAAGEAPGSTTVESWDGELVRLLSDLDRDGRMARALVSVRDPLSADRHASPLLLGSYVRVDVEAGTLEGVIAIPRTALRDGERLWVAGSDDRLVVRDTRLRWADGETLYVDHTLEEGERLITSSLRAALPGMVVAPQESTAPLATGTTSPEEAPGATAPTQASR